MHDIFEKIAFATPALCIVFLQLVLGTPQQARAAGSKPWYETCLVGMEVGPTGAQFGNDPNDLGYAAQFNGRDIVHQCADIGSEYIVIWARDGEYAYYDSTLMPKCPGLGQRDVLRETVEEAAKYEMPVIAYCVLQYGSYTLKQHPEYGMRDHEGKPINLLCFNSGYRDYLKDLVVEMLEYHIDGFHLDMVDQGFGPPHGCWCNHCKELFKKTYGMDMPSGVTWDEGWDKMLQFRYDTSARLEKDLRAHIHQLDPAVTVDFNYHGYPPFSWEVGQRPVQHAVIGDFVTGETGIWGFSALGVSLTSQFLAATHPGAVFQVAMQRGVRMYHDQTCRPVPDLRWELMTLLAHGTRVTVVDKTPYDGALDPVTYDRMKTIFAEAHAKQDHFGQKPIQDVGLYYSSRSRDWYGRQDPPKYQMAFSGAHKALVYEHFPLGIVLDENVTLARLKQFPVVLLANTTILSDREVDLFKTYVTQGGNLVVTGQTGLYDQMGHLRERSSLQELIGAKLVRTLDTVDNHFAFAEADPHVAKLAQNIRLDWPFLVKGPAAVYEATNARTVGELYKPHRTVRQQKGVEGTDWPMSADAPVGPAILINTVGKGKVITLAGSPDYATASEHRISEARFVLRNVVRFLDPAPRIEIEAPRHVEAIITDDAEARRLRVHFLAYQAPPATTPPKNRPYVLPSLIADLPLYRAAITLRCPFKRVTALNPTTEIRIDGNRLRLLVEDIHDVVVIDY